MKHFLPLGLFFLLLNSTFAIAAEKTALIENFEGKPQFEIWPPESARADVSDQWAADGKHSLLIHSGTMVVFNNPKPADWRDYQVWRFHVKVPGKEGVTIGLEIADPGEGNLNRHQDVTSAPPGESIIEVDIAGDLWRGEINKPYRLLKNPLNKQFIQRFAIEAQSGDIYIDQIELATVAKIATPGGFAFQFGKAGAVIQSQWTGINPASAWDDAKGYGITAGGHAFDRDTPYPTPVMGGGITMGDAEFNVKLKAGPYIGWAILERSGFWEYQAASYRKASLLVNAEVANSHQWDPAGFLFDFQDMEVLNQEDVVKMAIACDPGADFKFTAADGKNSFQLTSEGGSVPPRLAGIVIAPDTPEGHAFIDAHKKLQRDTIARVNRVLNNSAEAVKTAEPFITVPLSSDAEMRPGDLPAKAITQEIPTVHAFAGTTANCAVGFYAPSPIIIDPEAVDLKSADAAIPAANVRLLRNVYMPIRGYEQTACTIETHHYRADQKFQVAPGESRTMLIQVDIPPDAKPGIYRGEIGLTIERTLPISIEVHPGVLPATDFPVGLFFSGVPADPQQIGAELYWKFTEQMLQQMQRASLTMITGGPSAKIVWDGNTPQYQGDDFLHYIKLAHKYGLDKAISDYGGLGIGIPKGEVRAHGQMSEADTFSAVHKAWQDFSSANALPPYYIYCYDEPGTPAEFAPIKHDLTILKAAGFKTIGYTSISDSEKMDADHAMLVHEGAAVALGNHTPESLAGIKKMGTEPWLYGGVDRAALGVSLFRARTYGATGRFGWIGSIVQGFQYDTLDSREPDPSCFYLHREQGVLIAPRFVAVMEAGIDLRMLLELQRRAQAKSPAADKIDAFMKKVEEHPYHTRYSNEQLQTLRSEMFDLFKASQPG